MVIQLVFFTLIAANNLLYQRLRRYLTFSSASLIAIQLQSAHYRASNYLPFVDTTLWFLIISAQGRFVVLWPTQAFSEALYAWVLQPLAA